MRKTPAIIAIIGFLTGTVITLSSVYGQSVGACENRMWKEATEASLTLAQARNMNIMPDIMGAISYSTAWEICRRANADRESIDLTAVARKTVRSYFSAALEDGTPANIPGLVASFLENKYGLARPDYRSYGVLSLTCEPESQAFIIEVDSQSIGTCKQRLLVEAGNRSVRIAYGGTTACSGLVLVSPRSESRCVCLYKSETSRETKDPSPIHCDQGQ